MPGYLPRTNEQVTGCARSFGHPQADADMVVVGSYGDAAWSGMLAGPLALALVREAPCPVAVVRASAPQLAPPRRGPVVVGTDGTDAAGEAMLLGAELAAGSGAALLAVQAVTEVTDGVGAPRGRDTGWAELCAAAERSVDAQVALVRERYPDVRVDGSVVAGTALPVLLDQAATARMIVVGRRRETGRPGR